MNEIIQSVSDSAATQASTTPSRDLLPKSSNPSSDRILVTCPSPTCGAILSVRRVYSGKAIHCKSCSQKLLVPATAGAHPMLIYDGTLSTLMSGPQPSEINPSSRWTGTANSALLNHVTQFVAAFDNLQSAYDELQIKHTELGADRDQIRAHLDKANDELDTIRGELGAIAPSEVQPLAAERAALLGEVHRLRDESQTLRRERDETGRQLDLCRKDVDSAQTDLGRLTAELNDALSSVEQLTSTVAERDHAIASQRDEFRAEIETIREALFAAQQKDREETEQIKAEMSVLVMRYRQVTEEHRSAKSLCADLEARNQALVVMQDRLVAENLERALTADRERERLVAEIDELRAGAEETARVAEEMMTAARNQPSVRLASAEEIEVARTQTEALRWERAESEQAARVMEEMLDDLGAKTQPPAKAQPKLAKAGK